ncbi:MAG: PspC domain-containing protein [Chloroflexaceae bacterium]|nr:PspC domain-containing protein [Chloroflexaceae bacterium]NJO05990.1 PspC domain-containing protein [Chloroflexaceae bacterium]
MQTRLERSRTDRMLAGVCSGLGEYFAVDPVIVRLIFVLVTITSFVGLPVYILLWILMPQQAASVAPPAAPRHKAQPDLLEQQMGQGVARNQAVMVRRGATAQSRTGIGGQHGPTTPEQNVSPGVYTGQTVSIDTLLADAPANLPAQPSQPDTAAPVGVPATRRKRNWRTLGYVLLGIGMLILLEQLVGLNMSYIFPLLMIGAGILLLLRVRRP